MHEFGVGDVAVGEHHLVHLALADDGGQVLLGHDGYPLGVKGTGEGRGIASAIDVRYLRGGEGHHLVMVVIAEVGVEVVEIAPSRPHDDYLALLHDRTLCAIGAGDITIFDFSPPVHERRVTWP